MNEIQAEWRKAIADQVRRNCTPSAEQYSRGGDALVYAVADWIVDPPEWSQFTQPETRDEHHTMDELYDYRMLYNALAFNEIARRGTYPVVKSWRHSDGELCFGGGWFIVVATLPTGQVSNHYRAEFWDLFNVDVYDPPTYDGHTPAEAAARIREWLLNSKVGN